MPRFHQCEGHCKKIRNNKEQKNGKIKKNAKDTAKWLDEQLYEKNFQTGALHGNLTQYERETNLKRFRDCDIEVMVATDVAARGLDIEKVDTVINYDMPTEIDSYVHRIGRSGRIGNRGNAITFISTDEQGQALENLGVLKELLKIMRDANSDIPEWLEGLVEAGSSGWGGRWGGKDMRGGWGDANTGGNSAGAWDGWYKEQTSNDQWN